MKWIHHTLLFMLCTVSLCARGVEEYIKIHEKALQEWKQCNALIEKLNKLKHDDKTKYVQTVQEAIKHCTRVIAHCDTIIKDINHHKSKDVQKAAAQKQLKEVATRDKATCLDRKKALENILDTIYAYDEVQALHEKSRKKIEKAMHQPQPARTLSNVQEVVAALHTSSSYYEKAAELLYKAKGRLPAAARQEDKNGLEQLAVDAQAAGRRCRQEAHEWAETAKQQTMALQEKLEGFRTDIVALLKVGAKHKAYETQKLLHTLLQNVIEIMPHEKRASYQDELSMLEHKVEKHEQERDQNRLTGDSPSSSPEQLQSKQQERKKRFYEQRHFPTPSPLACRDPHTCAIALDGQTGPTYNHFILYTEQFYRFLIEHSMPLKKLFVHVYHQNQRVYTEIIYVPNSSSDEWDRHLLQDGMMYIPHTKLKSDFDFDLRIQSVSDPHNTSSIIICQKAQSSAYRFSIALDDDETPVYECDFLEPPPWQLDILRKPVSLSAFRPMKRVAYTLNGYKANESSTPVDSEQYPILDRLVDELKNDPLALTSYVYNEISLAPLSTRLQQNALVAPPILRNACMTFLEKRGSPWEQCQLLVYLLRKAGYKALYIPESLCLLPKDFVERMLFTKLSVLDGNVSLHFPGVLIFDGDSWIPLFPWMKEMQIEEGYDLYNFMPEKYASAQRWIYHYLTGDENISKHIGPNADDSLGVLFVHFVEEQLRKTGLAHTDIGVQRKIIKRQYTSWNDFLRPALLRVSTPTASLDHNSPLFDKITIEIYPHKQPHKKISQQLPLAAIMCNAVGIRFVDSKLLVNLIGESKPRSIDLDDSDHVIEIHLSHDLFQHHNKIFTIAKGTTAALCFHFGSPTEKIASEFHAQFASSEDEAQRTHALLAFVAASYFEKCSKAEVELADLHKVPPSTFLAFGLAKFSPLSPNNGELKLPQVDMAWLDVQSTIWQKESYTSQYQYSALKSVDASSNEHQILQDVFSDPFAISTVKLLQIAHSQHQKKELPGTGFLAFTPSIFELALKNPEMATTLYFSHMQGVSLRDVKRAAAGQWDITNELFSQTSPLSRYAYGYMTPGLTASNNNTYSEIATLLLHPSAQYALISSNTLVHNGGLGSPLSKEYFSSSAIKEWKLVPSPNNQHKLQTLKKSDTPTHAIAEETKWRADVRAEHKSGWNSVSDPVDVVTGAFYIDEIDITLPGPFPLEIRRNYSSQNTLTTAIGCGWKLSLNPYLVKQEDKLYAAEADGTVIAYSYNPTTQRWHVHAEDNPDLSNYDEAINPYHNYIQDDVLYGADGSKRFFENGQIKKWINAAGSSLAFFYSGNNLSRIESSHGDFCGLLYNHEGKIAEIYTQDGRRIHYSYSSQGDLVKVELPNTAIIQYEYDRLHRIIRETKPHGNVLENVYDANSRVIKQRTPMGLRQELVTTATFSYGDGETEVVDAKGAKTTYKIFQKQIYKIIDPLGNTILQSWYIDTASWFDAEHEQIVTWQGVGAAPKSLKTTKDKRGLSTHYLYDPNGNLAQITIEGQDLTGNGHSQVKKSFSYNEYNLCIKEEMLTYKTITEYDAICPYLPKRIEKYCDNVLIGYDEFLYNSVGLVEKEDHSGSTTLYKYNHRGFLCEKVQCSGTSDPDVVTLYAYNNQGQCISITTADGEEKVCYDIMGNPIETERYSLSGTLIDASYVGYNLNNEPLWKQTANPHNRLYLDYTAAGRIKASRHTITPSDAIAYTLYDYDACGYLTEEVDPLGYTTYRTYNDLGQATTETKEDVSTHYTYEAGGLVSTITSSQGATTKRSYTTNGLLFEELYPDGTKQDIIYDLFNRTIKNTKEGITCTVTYDDKNHRIIYTYDGHQQAEVMHYDARGNCICYTDRLGHEWHKSYDGLNRLISERSPCGLLTTYNYTRDTAICHLPSGETKVQRYEAGHVVETNVYTAEGILIATSSRIVNPRQESVTTIDGDEVTTTWMNSYGLPIKIQKGHCSTLYEYDLCGNLIAISDGRYTTRQHFDGLGRLIQKELPDGTRLTFVYDKDANLVECHLPNHAIWKASYDTMHRKCFEQLYTHSHTSQEWEYRYENGHLTQKCDPQKRMHHYTYDNYGRLIEEYVDGWKQKFSYDERGLCTSFEQIAPKTSLSWLARFFYSPQEEFSCVQRSYDADARLIKESIFLNGQYIQKTAQEWTPSKRIVSIDNHVRSFTYQNNRLIQLGTDKIVVDYGYNLAGKLISKKTATTSQTIEYNRSSLPGRIANTMPSSAHHESLTWDSAGRLTSYHSPQQQKQFRYNERGQLQSSGEEQYAFDAGKGGIGIRTQAPQHHISEEGIDAFGKVVLEQSDSEAIATTYDALGQVIVQNDKQFEWDPWGRLRKVADKNGTWEASYDALGRRLVTHYCPTFGSSTTTTSFYDPEEEFQEIGIQYNNQTFWKLYGKNSIDAVESADDAVVLMHTALGQLAAVVHNRDTTLLDTFALAYGQQEVTVAAPTDIFSYATSLRWLSTRQDPTGLIWMGERYYNPKNGRFLSPDPVAYPLSLDLYSYANGDPINFVDLDGRFASKVYELAEPPALRGARAIKNPRSKSYNAGSVELNHGAIGFVNGINNDYDLSHSHASKISRLAGGAKIDGTYNASHTLPVDVAECAGAHLGLKTPPQKLLKRKWKRLAATKGPDAKFLEICHSGGADHLKNALKSSRPSMRERIIVVAIAPSVIIPNKLCHQSKNYISRRDFVTHLDVWGKFRYGDELEILEPHSDAPFWDHDFQSPTFDKKLETHINEYLKTYGDKQ